MCVKGREKLEAYLDLVKAEKDVKHEEEESNTNRSWGTWHLTPYKQNLYLY